jgi:hypothetical protein
MERGVGIKMKKILPGMHTRISPRRTGHRYFIFLKGFKCFFYLRLYGIGIPLQLKTTVPGAFIRNFEKIAGHFR